VFLGKFRCRIILMHFSLLICGKFTRAQLAHQIFYLPHMEYEGSIGLVSRNFFIADFHVLGLFMAKKHDLSLGDKKISVCHAPLPL
jgi:hypothetical protein